MTAQTATATSELKALSMDEPAEPENWPLRSKKHPHVDRILKGVRPGDIPGGWCESY
jgi:hypothetical protein